MSVNLFEANNICKQPLGFPGNLLTASVMVLSFFSVVGHTLIKKYTFPHPLTKKRIVSSDKF